MVAHQQKFSAACWHVGDVAYALVATADFGELDRGNPVGPFSLLIELEEL